jgi:hypothetical protein
MGTNSSKWDREAHYASKTTRELEEMRDWWLERVNRPEHNAVAERELAYIRLQIAERIGKKQPQGKQLP